MLSMPARPSSDIPQRPLSTWSPRGLHAASRHCPYVDRRAPTEGAPSRGRNGEGAVRTVPMARPNHRPAAADLTWRACPPVDQLPRSNDMTTIENNIRNGVDTTTLFATLDAVKGNPEI